MEENSKQKQGNQKHINNKQHQSIQFLQDNSNQNLNQIQQTDHLQLPHQNQHCSDHQEDELITDIDHIEEQSKSSFSRPDLQEKLSVRDVSFRSHFMPQYNSSECSQKFKNSSEKKKNQTQNVIFKQDQIQQSEIDVLAAKENSDQENKDQQHQQFQSFSSFSEKEKNMQSNNKNNSHPDSNKSNKSRYYYVEKQQQQIEPKTQPFSTQCKNDINQLNQEQQQKMLNYNCEEPASEQKIIETNHQEVRVTIKSKPQIHISNNATGHNNTTQHNDSKSTKESMHNGTNNNNNNTLFYQKQQFLHQQKSIKKGDLAVSNNSPTKNYKKFDRNNQLRRKSQILQKLESPALRHITSRYFQQRKSEQNLGDNQHAELEEEEQLIIDPEKIMELNNFDSIQNNNMMEDSRSPIALFKNQSMAASKNSQGPKMIDLMKSFKDISNSQSDNSKIKGSSNNNTLQSKHNKENNPSLNIEDQEVIEELIQNELKRDCNLKFTKLKSNRHSIKNDFQQAYQDWTQI